MRTIRENQVYEAIDEAVKTDKRSILFISHSLEDRQIEKWFDDHPMYIRAPFTPNHFYEDVNGILRKIENSAVIDTDSLNFINRENVIWYIFGFGESSQHGFDSIIYALQNGVFINDFGNGETIPFLLDKYKLFIGLTADESPFYVSEKYYDTFDEVYLVEK